MSGRAMHIVAGVSAGVAIYGIIKSVRKEEWTFEGAAGSGLLGALGGMLPDILEPATNPCHRQFFHSLLFGAVLLFGKEMVFEALKLSDEQKVLFNSLLGGYSSHLVLDALTPKSLPIV